MYLVMIYLHRELCQLTLKHIRDLLSIWIPLGQEETIIKKLNWAMFGNHIVGGSVTL